ncbi:MAG TPA: type II and III secretion system protein family protein [Phycisphaerae bacterium]|nr:type II and III secretion system protein family protein [Phycisphaerae bacterium]
MTPKASDPQARLAVSNRIAAAGRPRWVIALAGAVVLASAAGLQAQLPKEADAGQAALFTAKVRDLTEGAEVIRITMNQSVLIETSQPVERVQAVDPNIAFVQSVSPMQTLLTGVGTGVSQVILWSEGGDQQIFQVIVELDLSSLNAALETVDPLSEVVAVPLMGNIVLTGTASSTQIAERMMSVAEMFMPPDGSGGAGNVQNHMSVAGEQQVLLRCTVAELSRSASRQLGINGFFGGENFRDVFAVNQIGSINPINFGLSQAADVTQNMLFATPGVPLGPNVPLSLGFPRVQLQVFLQALADNSLLRVLAEPNLVAVSGETASFLAGGEFPIPVAQSLSGGASSITIEFREFGVRLNFTPDVRPGQRIRLHISPEVSELDYSTAVQLSGFTIPGLTQRRVESTVEVGNGQTLAMAGLLNDEVRGIASRIPGMGDLPVLGALFRSVDYQRSITELVVLVTPELVSPLNPNQVPQLPGQNLLEPNDFELYGLGLLEGIPPEQTPEEPEPGPPLAEDEAIVQPQPDVLSVHGPWGPATESDLQ